MIAVTDLIVVSSSPSLPRQSIRMPHSRLWRIEKRITFINNGVNMNENAGNTCIATFSAEVVEASSIGNFDGAEPNGRGKSVCEELAVVRKYIQPTFSEEAKRFVNLVQNQIIGINKARR